MNSKNFANIVNLCFCIVRYVLYKADKRELMNLQIIPTVKEVSMTRSERSNSASRRSIGTLSACMRDSEVR